MSSGQARKVPWQRAQSGTLCNRWPACPAGRHNRYYAPSFHQPESSRALADAKRHLHHLQLKVTLARQRAGQLTAAVSPLSKRQLKTATEAARAGAVHELPIRFEECDTNFIGLTVLKSPDGANIEYECIVSLYQPFWHPARGSSAYTNCMPTLASVPSTASMEMPLTPGPPKIMRCGFWICCPTRLALRKPESWCLALHQDY
jgi:hypothetical protein